MKLSLSWLKKYVDVPEGIDALEAILTNVGLELEGVEDPAEALRGLVVGEVRTREKHPNADKLSVCTVFDGAREETVVCGAPNVAAGQKIAFAPVGTYLPKIDITIGRRTLRGVESAGMICSAAELGLSEDHTGIIVLAEGAVPGMALAQHLGMDDVTLEIGITPNRGDALSHIGIARDIAAATHAEVRMPAVPDLPVEGIPGYSVRIDDPDLCPRYSCALVKGVVAKESPDWMKRALERAGIRPINSLVDVTNYVMMEIGQPMHAFDCTELHGDAIVVRRSKEGEPFVTLDGKSHTLAAGSPFICDADRPVALAGVMGGENSEIRPDTHDVLLESAYFNASSVRRTARALSVSTESSYRFERGTDPNRTVWALQRAVELIIETSGGTFGGIIDCVPEPLESKVVDLHPSKTDALLGISIPAEEQAGILRALQFEVITDGDVLHCTVPGFRSDVEREIDLIEEVARIHGYDAIPAPERVQIHSSHRRDDDAFQDKVRNTLLGMGLDEVLTSSLVPVAHTTLEEGKEAVRVLNPVSAERPCLRSSLLASLLETVDYNLRNGTDDIRIFEIGSVFSRVPDQPADVLAGYDERSMAGVILAGSISERTWWSSERMADFYDIKGVVDSLLHRLALDKEIRFSYDAKSALSEVSLRIEADGVYVGRVMEIRRSLREQFGVDTPVMYAELMLEALKPDTERPSRYVPVARVPAVRRDLALLVDASLQTGSVVDLLLRSGIEDLVDVRVIDIFTHESLGADRKSLAVSLVFQPREKTLAEQEIAARVKSALRLVEERFGALLRT